VLYVKRIRPLSPGTHEAASLLGSRIRLARRQHRWTVKELGERLGVVEATVRKVERGDVTVAIGTVFEAAWVTGVVLFAAEQDQRRVETGRVEDQLALLPKTVRTSSEVNDDF
jgi:transcriptional regulator with XRE-family HTH domain